MQDSKHTLNLIIGDPKGRLFEIECPYQHLDYRAMPCSWGDLGCAVQVCLRDVDFEDMWNGGVIENPRFPMDIDFVIDGYEDDSIALIYPAKEES